MLETIVNSIPGGIAKYEIRPNGKLFNTYVSEGMTALWGMTGEEYARMMQEDPCYGIFYQDFAPLKSALENWKSIGTSTEMDFRINHKDGSHPVISVVATLTGNRNGNPEVLVVFQPQTRNAKQFQQIVSELDSGVFVFDRATREILYANHQAELLSGNPFRPGQSATCYSFFYNRQMPCDNCTFCAERDSTEEYESTSNGRNLKSRRMSIRWNGHDAVAVFAADITDQKRLEEQKQQEIQAQITRMHKQLEEKTVESMKLMQAVFASCDTVMSVNLTANTFHIMENSTYMNHSLPERGSYDEVVAVAANTIPLGEKQQFLDCLSREKLLEAQASGKTYVECSYLQYNDAGELHRRITRCMFTQNPYNADMEMIVVAQCVDAQYEDLLGLEKETQFRKILSHIIESEHGEGLIGGYLDADFTFYYANERLAKMLGYESVEEFRHCIGDRVMETIHPDDRERICRETASCTTPGDSYEVTYRMPKKDGTFLWIIDHGLVVEDAPGKLAIISRISDVSSFVEQQNRLAQENKNLAKQEAETKQMLLNMPGGYHRCSLEEGFPFLFVSPRFLNIVGWTEAELKDIFDNKYLNMIHPEDKSAVISYTSTLESDDAAGRLHTDAKWRILTKSGYRWILDNSVTIDIEDKHFCHGIITDFSEFVEADNEKQKKLEAATKAADRDPLTHCYNRRKLERMIRGYLGAGDARGAFFMLDLDHFKEINDTFGHGVGDELLIEVSGVIQSLFRSRDVIARFGGDEFVVFMTDVEDQGVIREKARLLESRLQKSFQTKSGLTLDASANIGVACYPQDASNYEKLYEKADLALYHSKHGGRKTFTLYSDMKPENL